MCNVCVVQCTRIGYTLHLAGKKVNNRNENMIAFELSQTNSCAVATWRTYQTHTLHMAHKYPSRQI